MIISYKSFKPLDEVEWIRQWNFIKLMTLINFRSIAGYTAANRTIPEVKFQMVREDIKKSFEFFLSLVIVTVMPIKHIILFFDRFIETILTKCISPPKSVKIQTNLRKASPPKYPLN